ncbi:MAG: hypothetical protein D6773_19530 [Alphaproteobacteria bacterium]|nr:MAG: hypothetical protein D6773_19530 [Alphaproteobacteria bacterium]
MTVFYRHQGLFDRSDTSRLRELVDDETDKRARIMGAALRAAHMVSASMPGIIPHTPVRREGTALLLDLPGDLAKLDGERLDRRFRVLAKELDLEGRVVAGSDALAASKRPLHALS